jgi:hypothetical protein
VLVQGVLDEDHEELYGFLLDALKLAWMLLEQELDVQRHLYKNIPWMQRN